MKRVALRKTEEGNYEIGTGNPDNESFNRDSEIRLYKHNGFKVKPVEGHYLIERHHYLGGGFGGWDSYEEFVGIAHSKEELPQKLHSVAVKIAKEYAKI